jgi:hypothetical protein
MTRKCLETPVVEPAPPEKKRGLRGKVIAKKTGEMKAELEAATALVHQYVPPDPGMMQVVINAGTASLAQGGPGVLALKFPGYVKPGDTYGWMSASKRYTRMRTFFVSSSSTVTSVRS